MFFGHLKAFFELHSRATEGKKDEKWMKKSNFLANGKSLNHFIDSDQICSLIHSVVYHFIGNRFF